METLRIYIDTNIFLYFLGLEESGQIYNKTKISKILFSTLKKQKRKIIVSQWTKEEIKKVLKKKNLNHLFEIITELIYLLNYEEVSYSSEDLNQAKNLNQKNWQDALHVILAKKYNCSIIITENKRDFIEMSKKVGIDCVTMREYLRRLC